MTDLTIDLIKQFREKRTAGWHDIAAAYERLVPESRKHTEVFGYFGVLFGLAAVAQPKVVVEIGTQFGLSTRAWLAATERTNGVVHSIDVDAECGQGELLEDVKKAGWTDRWTFHHGKSQEIEPIACDLLYVDGDHAYEPVCSDMERHGVQVRDGGLVVLDDYYLLWPGKMRWVNERWAALEPIIVGPMAIIRVTPAKRAIFSKVFP